LFYGCSRLIFCNLSGISHFLKSTATLNGTAFSQDSPRIILKRTSLPQVPFLSGGFPENVHFKTQRFEVTLLATPPFVIERKKESTVEQVKALPLCDPEPAYAPEAGMRISSVTFTALILRGTRINAQ
jgi:hypothetical protein